VIVFVHIPKTAGTALGQAFDYATGRRVFWDYDRQYRFAEKIQPEIRDNIGFIASYFEMIYGHFFVTKYRALLPDARYFSCVRHPVQRTISQYYHAGSDSGTWPGDKIASGEMNVLDFARIDMIGSAQTRHLAGMDLKDLDHLFITERLNASVAMFHKKHGSKYHLSVPQFNTRAQRELSTSEGQSKETSKIIEVTEDDKQQLFALCRQDVDLYRRAVEIHIAEVAKLS